MAAAAERGTREVRFPPHEQEVTAYFEPADPWQHVSPTTREQLAAEYEAACQRHLTEPIAAVVHQIMDLPTEVVRAERGAGARAPRLSLSGCAVRGAAAADALEALLRRVQFRRVDMDDTQLDDETAEAMFDMLEYYESVNTLNISGNRQFGIRGWQACSRMIKKSVELAELEARDTGLSEAHAPVLCRAIRLHTCRLRALRLQSAHLAGQPLLCLVMALKSNVSVRELQLGDNALSAADAAQLGSLLRANSTLQLLDLSNNQIQDQGVGHIADALVAQAAHSPPSAAASPLSPLHASGGGGGATERGLAVLVLWNNQLTRNSAHHLARALRSSTSLCVLNVGRNGVGCEGVRALRSPRLLCLGLQCARLGPDAAAPLADLIQSEPALQRLDLRENRLGAAGLRAVAAAMQNNRTLSQIDLDDPPATESASTLSPPSAAGGADEPAELARLTREIRALCRRNEPSGEAEPRRRQHAHRKISLTCHTSLLAQAGSPPEEERRGAGAGGRLRSPAPSPIPSPAPSPAGSPVPSPGRPRTGRFSVSRVTPERDSSDSSSPSTPATPPARSPPAASPASASPAFFSSASPPSGAGSRFRVMQVMETPRICIQSEHADTPRRPSSRFSVTRNFDAVYTPTHSASPSPTREPPHPADTAPSGPNHRDKQADSGGEREANKKSEVEGATADVKIQVKVVTSAHSSVTNRSDLTVSSDSSSVSKTTDQSKVEVTTRTNVTVSELMDGGEGVADKEASASEHLPKADVSEGSSHQVQIKVTEDPMKNIEAIAEDLGHLIQEMRDFTVTRKPADSVKIDRDEDIVNKTNLDSCELPKDIVKGDTSVPASIVRQHNVVLKKNKSESSLDSPDLEVSRFMNKREEKILYDSSSSLDISGSSVESLNASEGLNATETRAANAAQIVIEVEQNTEITIDSELDRRKPEAFQLSNESSLDSNTSEMTPINFSNNNFLNSSVSSNESVSPVAFGRNKKIHGSLSSLEASVSSLDSSKLSRDRLNAASDMVTSSDSGIEHSLHNPSEARDETADDGTLTGASNLKERAKDSEHSQLFQNIQETLTSCKRTSSLLDVPALKTKGLDRVRKISWVPPSPSFQVPRPELDSKIESKVSSNLDKLLSLFHNPGSLFSRSTSQNDESDKRTGSNTPPRKESTSVGSSFWTWGLTIASDSKEPDKPLTVDEPLSFIDDQDSSPENGTDSTLSMERVQVSYVEESFSKKLDSKTPSTETDNTLSEFQPLPVCISELDNMESNSVKATVGGDSTVNTETQGVQPSVSAVVESDQEVENKELHIAETVSTDNNIVQILDLSKREVAGSIPAYCDIAKDDLIHYDNPNDLNKVYEGQKEEKAVSCDNVDVETAPAMTCGVNRGSCDAATQVEKDIEKDLHSTGLMVNVLQEPKSTDNNQIVKVSKEVDIRPEPSVRPRSFAAVLKQTTGTENSLDRQPSPDTGQSVENLPTKVIRGIKENISPENTLTSSMTNTRALAQELTEKQSSYSGNRTQIVNALWEVSPPNFERTSEKAEKIEEEPKNSEPSVRKELCEELCSEQIDVARDALTFLVYGNQDFEPDVESVSSVSKSEHEDSFRRGTDLAEELRDAEMKEQIDLSPELIIDDGVEEMPEVFKDFTPEKVILKKANSLEDLTQPSICGIVELQNEQAQPIKSKSVKNIAFELPECSGSIPKDIPEASRGRHKQRSKSYRTGSSPKSLPESLSKPSPLTKMDQPKGKKKKINSLGKMARDSLLALNISEEEIVEFRQWHKLTSMESLRSVESVSEEVLSHSGHSSTDSRCRTCVRTSQESLMSLDSISEDCRCAGECHSCDKSDQSGPSKSLPP